jgi:peptidoglycan/LPS O-acetylase OafA/YrhL
MVIALSKQGTMCQILRVSALRFIGRISYSMYLVHMSAILIAKQFCSNWETIFIIALTMTIAYATISWYGIERKLQKANRSERITVSFDVRGDAVPSKA